MYSCDECKYEECSVSISGRSVTVTANVSGSGGTQITPDSTLSISNSSAEVIFKVLRVGSCHKVLGYGHVWSSTYATPNLDNARFVDYGENVNFGDQVKTNMNNLLPSTKYYVRGWIAIEKQDCDIKEREIFYNDNISEFTTLP